MSTLSAPAAPGAAAGSRLVLGCMGLGGDWAPTPYGSADVDEAAAAVDAALEIGITLFDHADIYRVGKSEAVFGEVLVRTPGLRDRIKIQTKCGIRLGDGGLDSYYDLSRAAILERVQESLKRLKTDYVDTLILHRPDPLMDPAEVAGALRELHEAGMVREVGVSNMSGAQMALLAEQLELPIVANQLELSLHKHDWLDSTITVNHPDAAGNTFPHGTIEYCRSNGVRLQAWGPLAQGIYSGPGEGRTAAEAATADLVASLAAARDTTPEAIVLGWLLKHPAGIDAVIGTKNPERIRACRDAEAQSRLMTRTEWYSLYIAARGAGVP
ncbi:aldo/keto reductase [Pseudarthrobacter sp. P1]|uniref:aldo/keto reductase n=1 Tax=Pseudarthrobacter sp. P1 TaxID=3418418 RepID=UPI003CECF729